MSEISCLVEDGNPIALDSSVIVNLNATGFADRIVAALSNDVVVVRPVLRELERGERNGHTDAADLRALVESRTIFEIPLPRASNKDYLSLVSGSAAQTLGDGEAATIAFAAVSGAWAAIDERKARRICADRFRNLPLASTIDILAHPSVVAEFTQREFSDLVFNAMEVARMQVQAHQIDWVCGQVGSDRISRCLSLPLRVRVANGS